MHLEDVIIEGFKSFSKSTSMSFQPGIGVIIGNNGVGKSNILDAIVWAMGENDLTRLRCLEADELFFSGSNDYPPAETIRVELNFKNGNEKNVSSIRLVRKMEKDGEKIFGDGPLDILHRVKRTGSLRQAAEEINMSYSQAWNLIKDLEKRLEFNLLERKVGGERGGGSEITEEARKLMTKFKLFREEADLSLNSLY